MNEKIFKRKNDLDIKRSTEIYKNMKDRNFLTNYYKLKVDEVVKKIKNLEISGSSPTDIFIGSYGYPKVFIGPLVSLDFNNAQILGKPELWANMNISAILNMRSKLIRGTYFSNIFDIEKGRIQEQIRDLALAENPALTEISLLKKPVIKIKFDDQIQPFGPTAEFNKIGLSNIKADRNLESKYNDTDANASTAVAELYKSKISVSKIQQALSAGLFGLKNKRKFVPTRWSITAVDDIISKNLREKIKANNTVDAIYGYHSIALDNHWIVFLMPGNWEFESIESWYPKTTWNKTNVISICSSYEGFNGRSTYAEISGGYYAARLAVAEKLKQINKQAKVLILREVHENYSVPVGVWNIREHLRQALEKEPVILNNIKEIYNFISKYFTVPVKNWKENSRILKNLATQKTIMQYIY